MYGGNSPEVIGYVWRFMPLQLLSLFALSATTLSAIQIEIIQLFLIRDGSSGIFCKDGDNQCPIEMELY